MRSRIPSRMALLPFPKYESVGQLFSFDRFMDLVGEGSFALVYKAKLMIPIPHANLTPGQTVALKVINKDKLGDDKALRDVIKEVEMCRNLSHPCFVPVYHVIQTATEIFMVMEFVEGIELYQLIREAPKGQLREGVAVQIAYQLLQGLQYLHDTCKIVHRDLKPENVMVCGSTDNISESTSIKVRIVDFGLAKYIGTSQRRTRLLASGSTSRIPQMTMHRPSFDRSSMMARSISTASVDSAESSTSHTTSPMLTTPCGTLKYNAPEAVATMMGNGSSMQLTTRGELIKRDMYSLGSVVYVMLSGKLPFTASSKKVLLDQMRTGPAMDNPRWSNVSDNAKLFVATLLSVDPKNRPTASEAQTSAWFTGLAPQTAVEHVGTIQAGDDVDDNQPRTMGRRAFSVAFDSIIDADDDERSAIIPSESVPHNAFSSGPVVVAPCDED